MSKKNATCTYYVTGMHCQSCELLLEKKLSKHTGVLHTQASLKDKTVTFVYNRHHGKPDLDELNNLITEHGYTLGEQPLGKIVWNQQSIFNAIIVIALLSIAYLAVLNLGFIPNLTLSNSSSLGAFFLFGIIAGLSSCAALVGGLLLSLSKQWNGMYGGNKSHLRFIPFTMFNIGRLISYALLGGLLGIIGAFFQLSLGTTAVLVVVVSVIMIILGLQMLGIPWISGIKLQLPSFITRKASDEQNFQGKYMPFLAGAFTFLIPCGFTLIAQTVALTSGNFITSALMMLSFALGTLPVLAMLSFTSMKFQTNPTFAGTFNLVAGFLIVAFGFYNINAQFNVLGIPNVSTLTSLTKVAGASNNTALNNEGLGSEIIGTGTNQYQQINMKAEGFEYFPRTLSLKAGVLTKLNVKSKDVTGCAQAMYLSGLYDEVVFLNKPETSIEFTPKKGTYKISCAMGMVDPVNVVVN
ncbi:hypothetical protein A2862_03250 [Candidatus Roizmanbacteria bacterium RIFCSPHIGHO2_01_FULL_38_41]|uniref:HMA domain-containing protein n=1 Tax=Candidatus Roizmanbacteria bacterium RIFCSPHIGHO2_02_FULL_37_24 TaxID=1802037 RepID=A0A1F7GVD6_9BACT|nr:MAG: hypothetical protein A2862_03250 [Candidatus Roizmanbacteria bacterium RIFCSPHIGHO2_01_FULL_38_41]OGK22452.1 MAG: hypothetical protein A3C24_03965 [Candidatus Roizmanbacteria bacterium RIFCSPHIGHO2_02_FULL_37_24]OGK33109.1 MAG: hypothetical protein A3E10_00885 [Candidatus Roizmanbacteria bacterium RIFCSPHIGHO2_12_FULL_37_23]OGK43441.1 MAG: hypothetical protein A2956_02545 [Candidatus Roizmanbacteria bacterium RIFCSPLOWO2_01_FULL_37_57]OGK61423.1 MAG: hypothetical protein A3G65_00200 [Ca